MPLAAGHTPPQAQRRPHAQPDGWQGLGARESAVAAQDAGVECTRQEVALVSCLLGNARDAPPWSRQAAGLRVPLLKDPSPAQQHTYLGELQYTANRRDGVC